jgi:hypothetical protein
MPPDDPPERGVIPLADVLPQELGVGGGGGGGSRPHYRRHVRRDGPADKGPEEPQISRIGTD